MLAVLAAAVTLGAAAASPMSYAFGRTGGNIVPFTITIAASGAVAVTGPAHATKARLGTRAMAALAAAVRTQRFFSLPRVVSCSGALPDFASSFVTVRRRDTSRTVVVRGDCSARFTRVYTALAAAVGMRP